MTLDCRKAGLAVPIGEFDKVEPVVASFRRLERGSDGALRFVAPYKARKVDAGNWCDVLAEFTNERADCVEEVGRFDTTVAEGQPPVTPLSINLPRPTIILIHLHDSSTFQFSARGSGFTVLASDHEQTALSGKLVERDGKISVVTTDDFPGEGSAIESECRYAFFAVKPPKGSGIFTLPFNVHLEQKGLIEKAPYTLPIIVDPDTRHPGGGVDP